MPEAVAASIRDAAGRATTTLAEAGCDSPRLDAELLLAEALGCDRAELVLRADSPVPVDALECFERLVARRAAREPVAYILGRKEFRRITLSVDRRALIPRPETELLVEVGVSLPPSARVVDVGTGTGAVALALKDERPDLSVVAVDIDSDALDLARENATRLGLEVSFVQADLLDGDVYDAVLANLPYLAAADELPPEIAQYDPRRALFGGAHGLDLIRRLIPRVAGVPVVALEVGRGQAREVGELLCHTGFMSVESLRDLAGIERVVVGRS